MKLPRLIGVVVLLLASWLSAAANAGSGIATPESLYPQLDSILKQAVTQSPRMVARAVDEEIAENDRITARAGMLPTLSGSYRIQDTRDTRADLPGRLHVQKQYYDFNVTQPVFHWGEKRNNARMGEIKESIARGNYREAYRLFAQEVRSSYLRLILGKLKVARAEYYRSYAEGQEQQGLERLAKKTLSEAQMFNLRMEAEKSRIAAERARFDFENDKASFARITGQPVLGDAQIPDYIAPVTDQAGTVNSLLDGFLKQKELPTAEAVVMRQSMKIDRLNLANAKTRLRPKVNATLGMSQDEQSFTLNVAQRYQVNSVYAGFSVNWTLFDGLAAGAAQRSALARVRQGERDYNALTARLEETARSQAKVAEFTARFAVLNDRYLESAEGGLKVRKDDFARGVISQEDVSSYQLTVYDSQLNAFSTRADYLMQLCDFLGTVVQDPVLENLSSQ